MSEVTQKIPLKEVLAAVDMGASDMWQELDENQQKALKKEFFILTRYISNVKGKSREMQEHFVLTVNEFYNKHWNTLQQHPELLWRLLCMCSHESKNIFFHEWIGFKKKAGNSNNKIEKFLLEIYPSAKQADIEMLASTMSKADAKKLAEQYGYEKSQISKMF